MKPRAPDFESSAIEAAAADWLVRRRDGLPPEAEASYQTWLAADRRHGRAMAELGSAWDVVSFPAAIGRDREAAHTLDGRSAGAHRRRTLFLGTGLAAAAVLAFGLLVLRAPTTGIASTTTVVARPQVETLPDGSKVEFNAGAEITLDFTPAQRNVRLVRGEALFSVTKNAARPFVVSAGGVEVRAVGTAFTVRCDANEVGVLVTEGRVAVGRAAPIDRDQASDRARPTPAQPIYVDAGRHVALAIDPAGQMPVASRPLSAAEIGAALAWRGKRVEFTRMPLADAAILFNRENQVQLAIADRATGTMPISGIFWSDDPEAFARLVASGLGVRAERSGDTITLVSH